jgi:hypothetical protein
MALSFFLFVSYVTVLLHPTRGVTGLFHTRTYIRTPFYWSFVIPSRLTRTQDNPLPQYQNRYRERKTRHEGPSLLLSLMMHKPGSSQRRAREPLDTFEMKNFSSLEYDVNLS